MHEGDKAECDCNGKAVGVDHEVGYPLQEAQALDEMGHHGFANPAQGQADDRDAKLDAVDDLVQVAMETLQNSGAYAARLNELLDACVADGNQSKFRGGKEGVGRNQGKD